METDDNIPDGAVEAGNAPPGIRLIASTEAGESCGYVAGSVMPGIRLIASAEAGESSGTTAGLLIAADEEAGSAM